MKMVMTRILMVAGWMALLPLAIAQNNAPSPAPAKTRILIVTGMDYPGHLWRQTWPVLAEALRQDPRLDIFTIEDPHFLDSTALARYQTLVMHWQNWEQPGPGTAAQENFRKYVQNGKGVVVVHFGCGAWHGEWSEYGQVIGRAWYGSGPGKTQHDPYGPFRIEIVKREHPIMRGMTDFDTTDELYTCLVGEHPIEILAHAQSKVDSKYYPMAFVSQYGKGRSFHCPLGHDVKALTVPEVQELYRRGTAWAAGLDPVPTPARR
ncbi:MAG TPA: ThuA domain-containing protein [Candidatus Paceibacterota bacterium]|nr:ThuA domain-containing protein [Candidatus Paceibacterota bacterium]